MPRSAEISFKKVCYKFGIRRVCANPSDIEKHNPYSGALGIIKNGHVPRKILWNSNVMLGIGVLFGGLKWVDNVERLYVYGEL